MFQKPQILVNGKVSENLTRISDDVFQINVDKNKENSVTARILSTKKKYNSELSESINCI